MDNDTEQTRFELERTGMRVRVLTIRRTYRRNGAVKPINPLLNSQKDSFTSMIFCVIVN